MNNLVIFFNVKKLNPVSGFLGNIERPETHLRKLGLVKVRAFNIMKRDIALYLWGIPFQSLIF